MTVVVSSISTARRRSGITLTEILIAILILGVGLASLATLFPLGLLRLRDAARSTRSAYLAESAAADVSARGLLTGESFNIADQYNLNNGLPSWFWASAAPTSVANANINYPYSWNPMNQDSGYYGDDPNDGNAPGASAGNSGGYGLPFAYDPLWRFQTQNPSSSWGPQGYYLNDTSTFEARFGAGLGFIQNDPSDTGIPSAHGLQRLTNFTRPYVINASGNQVPIMAAAYAVPNIFVSPEDVVWVENVATSNFSPVLPDMSIQFDLANSPTTVNDWRYSWMFTGQQTNGSTFEGNIVIFENRPFGITDATNTAPNAPGGNYQAYQVDGEVVVEGIFGYSANISAYGGGTVGFGVSADRAVLLRWYNSQPDPSVRVGDWIADVTYERVATTVTSRFGSFQQYDQTGTAITGAGSTGGLQNPYNNAEWDNLPAQRRFWYRVQKVMPATDDSQAGFRSMVVYVDRSLQARTPLNAGGQPYSVNAALIAPAVVNVIPQTFFTR